METIEVWRAAHDLRSYAEHFAPRDYAYSRNLGGLKHIRYRSDFQSYNSPLPRLKRAGKHLARALMPANANSLDVLLFGEEETFSLMSRLLRAGVTGDSKQLREVGKLFQKRLLGAYFSAKYDLKLDDHRPDGMLDNGSIITFWEETGEYLQMVQPTVGSLLADFLEADPQHPQAQALAQELTRIREDYRQRCAQGKPLKPEEPYEALLFTTPQGGEGYLHPYLWDFGVYAYIFYKDEEGKPHHWMSTQLQGLKTEELEGAPDRDETLREAVLNVVAGAVEETIYTVEEEERRAREGE